MSRYTVSNEQHVAALRRQIATGHYAVNATNVANSIVRKLRDINRARQVLNDPADDRTQRGDESIRPGL
jgi:Anti-sigma-28 factor, FlgM